jgi:hypothetical protein
MELLGRASPVRVSIDIGDLGNKILGFPIPCVNETPVLIQSYSVIARRPSPTVHPNLTPSVRPEPVEGPPQPDLVSTSLS